MFNDLSAGKYLGLPSLIGRSKNFVFNFLKERLEKKIQGWNNKILSRAGRTVLLKNVAQSIPSYCMSCFKIPKTLCQEMERLMNGFRWCSTGNAVKGIRWLSWDRKGLSKDEGGLGFRNLTGFNLALLGKHCWKFITNPQSLVTRVFKARYYPDSHFLQAKREGGASYIWSGIWEAKEALGRGFRWVLGDGETISAHRDPWLKGKNDFYLENYQQNSNRGEKVSFISVIILKSGTRIA